MGRLVNADISMGEDGGGHVGIPSAGFSAWWRTLKASPRVSVRKAATAKKGSDDMRQMPDLTGLPTVLDALLRPWVSAIESTGLGMGAMIASAAVSSSLSLERRVIITAAISSALAEAQSASDAMAQKLNKQMPAQGERREALAALAVLIETLRQSEPSEGTRALGLGW